MNERALISALRALPLHPGARGLQDDAAVLEVGGETLVLTHDTLVEGVHVLERQDAADIAWKLVAVNLSDLAAKGAEPVGILLSHMLGPDDERFVEGLRDVLSEYDVPLLGGDTVAGDGQRVWGCTAIGRATHVPVPSRTGASTNDALYLAGRLGEAMLGFEALRDGTGAASLPYRRPVPLLEAGHMLAPLVTAMMDVSDGLLLDTARLAAASGVTIAIDTRAVRPHAPPGRLADAMRWGDDYALLFTLPADQALPVSATRIGAVIARTDSDLLIDGNPPTADDPLGYQHGKDRTADQHT